MLYLIRDIIFWIILTFLVDTIYNAVKNRKHKKVDLIEKEKQEKFTRILIENTSK